MRVTHYSYVLIKPFYGFRAIHPVSFSREVIGRVRLSPGFNWAVRWRGAIGRTGYINGKFRTRKTTTKVSTAISGRKAGALAAYTVSKVEELMKSRLVLLACLLVILLVAATAFSQTIGLSRRLR